MSKLNKKLIVNLNPIEILKHHGFYMVAHSDHQFYMEWQIQNNFYEVHRILVTIDQSNPVIEYAIWLNGDPQSSNMLQYATRNIEDILHKQEVLMMNSGNI